METVLQASQAREMAALDARSRSLIGWFRHALDSPREVRKPESGRLRLVRLPIRFVLSSAVVCEHLAARQRSEREVFAKASKGQLAQRITEVKTARERELAGLTTLLSRDRGALISRQDAEKAKMKEAWRAAPAHSGTQQARKVEIRGCAGTRGKRSENQASAIERRAASGNSHIVCVKLSHTHL